MCHSVNIQLEKWYKDIGERIKRSSGENDDLFQMWDNLSFEAKGQVAMRAL